MVGFNRSAGFPDGYDPVAARVIARSPTVWYAAITIDKGSDQGVRVNQPVLSGTGLVGKVSDVAPDAARVTLLTDHTSGVSAQVVPDGANGIVKATVGNPIGPDPRLRAEGPPRAEGRDRDHVRVALVASGVALPARHPDRLGDPQRLERARALPAGAPAAVR